MKIEILQKKKWCTGKRCLLINSKYENEYVDEKQKENGKVVIKKPIEISSIKSRNNSNMSRESIFK